MTQVILMLPESVAREAEAADTDCPASVPQMARAWQSISRPLPEDDAVLSVDPDRYPFL
jgi:hypothetical protein